MPQGRTNLDHDRKTKLRNAMLRFFSKPLGNRLIHVDEMPELADFSKDEIRQMTYSLDTSGLITRKNDAATSGAMYGITELGRAVLELAKDQ